MLGMNERTGGELEGVPHIWQSVKTILTTPVGSRVMVRDFGSRLPELVDNPITPTFIVDCIAETAIALSKWEPRIRVDRVTVKMVSTSQPHRVRIDLTATIIENGQKITLEGIVL